MGLSFISFLFYVKSRKGAGVLDLNKIDYEQVDVGNIEKVIIANGIINPVNIISINLFCHLVDYVMHDINKI